MHAKEMWYDLEYGIEGVQNIGASRNLYFPYIEAEK